MLMSFLIGPEDYSRMKQLRAYAEQTEHFYNPAKTGSAPGDDPNYTCVIGESRIAPNTASTKVKLTYTVTEWERKLLRHLSVRGESGGVAVDLPEDLVQTLAGEYFGFIGGKELWQIERDPHGAYVILQPFSLGLN